MTEAMFIEILKSFSGAVVGAVAAYAAVKEKMGELMARISAAEQTIAGVKKDGSDALHLVRATADHAHARLDGHVERYHSK